MSEHNKDHTKDHTELDRLQRALDREKRRYELLLQSMVDGVYTTDADKRIVFWNDGAERITGFTADMAVGTTCKDLLGHLDESGNSMCDTSCPISLAMDEDTSLLGKDVYSNTRSGEVMPVSVSCSPLKDENGDIIGAVEVFRDISEKKKLEEEKKRFFQLVTHDLKTPLTAIMGYADLLLEGPKDIRDQDAKEQLRVIKNSAEKMNLIITDFLNLVKMETSFNILNKEMIALPDMINRLMKVHAQEAERKKIKLVSSFKTGHANVEMDARMMERALSNLITNAIKYTQDGGSVEISASDLDTLMELSVTDNGCGIPEDERNKVFDMYYRCEGTSGIEGTGLGLPLVKAVASAHGGNVHVENGPDGGSRFTITLPLGPSPEGK